MTPLEFYAAIEGWQEANGVEPKEHGPSVDELRDLMDKFPDKR